jgi:hypothetical protein
MKRGILGMRQRERQRYHALKMVLDDRITLREAGQAMGVEWFDKEELIHSSQYYKVLTH